MADDSGQGARYRGDLVEVYVTPRTASGRDVPAPTLVLSQVAVDSREGGSRSFSGQSALAVVLVVDAADVSSMVHAVESGVIDLVRVPPAAAGSRS